MASVIMVDSLQNTVPDTIETFFTAPAGTDDNGIRITAFTASNNTAASVSYLAYIYRGGVATEAIVPRKIVVRDKFDLAPGIVNQFLNPGDTLRMESSTENSIVFRVTGNAID